MTITSTIEYGEQYRELPDAITNSRLYAQGVWPISSHLKVNANCCILYFASQDPDFDKSHTWELINGDWRLTQRYNSAGKWVKDVNGNWMTESNSWRRGSS